MKYVGQASAYLGWAIACYLFILLSDRPSAVQTTQQELLSNIPTYLSFVSVLLTAVTAVLAALAIGIGVIAAYTFKELKDEARAMSERIAQKIAADALSEVKVKAMVFELYAKAEKERQQAVEWPEDPTEVGER